MEENRKKIEELREFYKNKKSKNDSSNNDSSNNDSFFNDNAQDKHKGDGYQSENNSNSNKNYYSDSESKKNQNNNTYTQTPNEDESTDNPNYIDFKYILQKIQQLGSRFKKFYKYALSTLIFMLTVYLIIFLIDSYYVKDLVHSRNIIIVPSIIGKKLGQAQLELNDKNLKYEIIKRQFDIKLPKGTVIRQVPSPGRQIKENRIIYLTVSDGIEEITTPELTNLSSRQARVELVNSGLNLGEVTEINSENIEPGLVISQSPKAGVRLNYNDKVNIVISKGSENQIILKDFKYKTLTEVEDIISDMGLKIGSIIYVEDETFENGTIIGQFPLSGEIVLKNSYIDLEVVKK